MKLDIEHSISDEQKMIDEDISQNLCLYNQRQDSYHSDSNEQTAKNNITHFEHANHSLNNNIYQPLQCKSQYQLPNYIEENEYELGNFGSEEHAYQNNMKWNQQNNSQNNNCNNSCESTKFISSSSNNTTSLSSQNLSQSEKTEIFIQALKIISDIYCLSKQDQDMIEQQINSNTQFENNFESSISQQHRKTNDENEKIIKKDKNQSTTNICRELFLTFIKKQKNGKWKYSDIMSIEGIEEDKYEKFCRNKFNTDLGLVFNQRKFSEIKEIKYGQNYYKESQFLINLIKNSYQDLKQTILNNQKNEESQQHQQDWLDNFFKKFIFKQ